MRLHAKLTLPLLLFAVVLISGIGVVVYQRFSEQTEGELNQAIKAELHHMKMEFEALHRAALANTMLFAESDRLQHYLVTDDEIERYRLLQPNIYRLFKSYQRAYPEYVEIRLLLPNGDEDTRITIDPMPNKREQEGRGLLFQHIDASPQQQEDLLMRSEDDGSHFLYVSRRLLLRNDVVESLSVNPSNRGYLVLTVSLDQLAQKIKHSVAGTRGRYLFVGPDGSVIFHSKGLYEEGPLDVGLRMVLHSAIQSGEQHRVLLDGEQIMLWGLGLQDGYKLAAVVPITETQQGLLQLGGSILLWTLLAILITVLLLYRNISTILIQPLHALRQAASAIARGELTVRSPLYARDEIGELVEAFNYMGEELLGSHKQINELAFHDPLTGLANRRLFTINLDNAIQQARRNETPLALLFVDLDNFKRINDTLGHEIGDLLLIEVATRIHNCMRATDLVTHEERRGDVSRLGGDEFTALLTSIENSGNAFLVARRVLDAISRPLQLAGHELYITASIGIAVYPQDGADAMALMKSADTAMYHAKGQGKNNCQYFDASMNRQTLDRLQMESKLRWAIANNELSLHYQPQVDLETGRIVGAEALVRWTHSEDGVIPPGIFIPIAEESGLIIPIGEWILRRACMQLAEWQAQGINDITLSINISAEQFRLIPIAELINTIVKETGVAPHGLILELTEGILMGSEASLLTQLQTLKQQGMRISLDDFGTGYSSLSYLNRFPIDELKIDKSFIDEMSKGERHLRIISAIIELAECLEMTVVAEGVESQEQVVQLQQRQCRIIQGYVYSPPVPVEAFLKLIERFNHPEV